MTELFFRVRNLKKAYGNHVVLSGVNFDIYKGEILGVIGTSGSGKTTLLHSLIGFLRPDQGEVRILVEPSHRALGQPAYKDVHNHPTIVKRVFGFASQAPSFYDDLTVAENLKYFGSLYELPKHTIETNMHILLHLMDLDLARKSLGKNLSGGMERRLDIACALMHDPAVLILDEPTADLDPVLRNNIYDLIKKINSKETTIVLASHHLADLERVCDRIAILKEGKIFAVGTLAEIKRQFSDYSQVRVRLAKELYEEVEDGMEDEEDLYIHSEKQPNGLVFYTDRPNECARAVIRVSKQEGDKVEDLHIGKPSLDDIFISIMKDDKKKSPEKKSSSKKRKRRKSSQKKHEQKDDKKAPEKKDRSKKPSEKESGKSEGDEEEPLEAMLADGEVKQELKGGGSK
ncbi:MAG: ATP-binding cassette domain-containing protein [Candidatus Woesearchaeota archaeon]